jgi:hypothetical protein
VQKLLEAGCKQGVREYARARRILRKIVNGGRWFWLVYDV